MPWNERSVGTGSRLEPSDAADGDGFGGSCAISGNGAILAVGATGWEGAVGTTRGTVYVFDWNGSAWVERAIGTGSRIEPADSVDNDEFGRSCAISNDGAILVVGAHRWEGAVGIGRGTIYVYDWNGSAWVERAVGTASRIEPPDAADGDAFGASCSLSDNGTILIVGSPSWDGATGSGVGTIYVYDWNGSAWVERAVGSDSRIQTADAANNDFFGFSSSLSNDGSVLAGGANLWEGAVGLSRGTVYVYDSGAIVAPLFWKDLVDTTQTAA